jgi:hypothetical protein
MGWEKGGKYYTRSRRVGGRVVREYVGMGDVGFLAGLDDWRRREDNAYARERRNAERAADVTREKALIAYCQVVDAIVVRALALSGYHLHKGEWRRKRGTKEASIGSRESRPLSTV